MEPILLFFVSIFLICVFYLTGRCVSIFCAILSYCSFVFLLLLHNFDEFILFIFVLIPLFLLLLYMLLSVCIGNLRDHIHLDILIPFMFVFFLLILDMSLVASAPAIYLFLKDGGFSVITFENVWAFWCGCDKAFLLFSCEFFLKESAFCLLVAGVLICLVISFVFSVYKLFFRLLWRFVQYLRKKDGGV